MPPNLDDLWDELNRGRIVECSLRDPKFHLDGLQSGEYVYIDPRSSILETLIHELTHRRHPRMGERTVAREARRLLATMDDATKARWWRQYRKLVKKGPPVETSD